MALRASAATDADLAKLYGVHKDTITAARRGQTWAHLPGALGPRQGRRDATRHLTDEDIRAIRRGGAPGVEMARRCRVTPQTLSRIKLGQVRRDAGGPIRSGAAHASRSPIGKRARLSPEQVAAIRASGGTLAEVSEQFGVSPFIVSRIKQGRPWKHLRNGGPPKARSGRTQGPA